MKKVNYIEKLDMLPRVMMEPKYGFKIIKDIIWPSGIKAWFIEDKQYKEEEFKKIIKRRN